MKAFLNKDIGANQSFPQIASNTSQISPKDRKT